VVYIYIAAAVATEVPMGVIAEVITEIAAEINMEVAGRTKLKALVKIRQPKELKVFNSLRLSIVLLIAIRY
jgi:hypothetical protein